VFDWLFEGRLAVYIVLGAFAFVFLLCWKQVPRRAYLIGFGVAAALLLLYFLLDRFVETDREEIQRKVEVMARNVQTGDVDAIFANVSRNFRVGSTNREGFRQFAESAIRSHRAEVVIVWDFEFPDDFKSPIQVREVLSPTEVRERNTEVAQFSFLVRCRGSFGEVFERCEARFIRDPDGQWRFFDFRLRNPVDNSPVSVPGL
jgi:hypothetical protein